MGQQGVDSRRQGSAGGSAGATSSRDRQTPRGSNAAHRPLTHLPAKFSRSLGVLGAGALLVNAALRCCEHGPAARSLLQRHSASGGVLRRAMRLDAVSRRANMEQLGAARGTWASFGWHALRRTAAARRSQALPAHGLTHGACEDTEAGGLHRSMCGCRRRDKATEQGEEGGSRAWHVRLDHARRAFLLRGEKRSSEPRQTTPLQWIPGQLIPAPPARLRAALGQHEVPTPDLRPWWTPPPGSAWQAR